MPIGGCKYASLADGFASSEGQNEFPHFPHFPLTVLSIAGGVHPLG